MSTDLLPIKTNDFKPIKSQFLSLKDENTFSREVGFAVQLVSSSDQLQKADRNSILKAVYNTALTGLTLNPVSKLCYLVTRWNNKQRIIEACLEPSYQGLIKLITDAGSVNQVYANIVYKGDVFRVVMGTTQEIYHEPKFESRGIEKVYAVAILSTGEKQFEVMTKADLDDIRELSESYKAYKAGKISSCVWISHEGEMSRKTILRRIVKYLPKTDRMDRLNEAINLDEQDYKPDATMQEVSMIESLLRTSSLPENEIEKIEGEIYTMDRNKAWDCINYLKDNQRDPIESGDRYTQSAIRNKLADINADDRK